jgi:hypothetical protein
VAKAPITGMSSTKFRRGFGLDPIKSDVPLGSAASLVIHGGILLSALLAWQATPPIMPEDVVAVDMVSDTPSVKGENTTAETAQTGVDTPNPSPLPQMLPPSQSETLPTPEPAPSQETPVTEATPPAPILPPPLAPAPAPAPAPSPPPPPPPPSPAKAAAVAPTPKPAPAPISAPAVRPTIQPTPKIAPKIAPQIAPKLAPKLAPRTTPQAPSPVRTGQRQSASTAPVEFDLAAAASSASGADSGGRRAPQLASRGQAGRLGKAGGGAQLTGDLEAALRSQIQPCWLEPANMADASRLLVVVSIDLGVDGRLLRDPIMVTPSSRAGASPSLVVAIDNALRAVRECAPFNLPPDRYESWRQVRFNFDPRRMARP